VIAQIAATVALALMVVGMALSAIASNAQRRQIARELASASALAKAHERNATAQTGLVAAQAEQIALLNDHVKALEERVRVLAMSQFSGGTK
jgi:ubiquinone biosynthesis protein UbiJ